MFEINDQLGRTLVFKEKPKRIISVVPSQTELLWYLGLEEEVVGITKFCIHPDSWYRTKTRVGGTKTLDFEKIAALSPDLIIANKEENTQSEIEALMELYPVWISDIYTVEDALDMMTTVGDLLGKKQQAVELVNELSPKFEALKQASVGAESYKVAYFIWQGPYMVAGSDTFIQHLLELSGFDNVFGKMQRYFEVTMEDLRVATPDLILLSSEPYPFKEKHIKAFQTVCPNAQVLLVDGELFSWYGSRLLGTVDYIQNLRKAVAQNRLL
ncbi:MAG: ABC transporter substrate-binding protein [Aureispira sp.]|nr:ABC transporter substrate-binding protein [Aureispira sp.]